MTALLVLHGLAALGLLAYGLNAWWLTLAFLRGRRRRAEHARRVRAAWGSRRRETWPTVCVQLPVRNERTVVDGLLRAVAHLDWPRDRLHVQLLDDSDDDTSQRAAARIAALRAEGLRVDHVRRRERTGYKAGALAHGLTRTDAELVAIFDADFVPAPDTLQRLVPFVTEPGVALAQARWGHLERTRNGWTRAQALAIDGHFGVEQAGRAAAGWFVNFNGTAGVWRREAIDAAGGWSAATLTEDLELSYRAQLAGWTVAVVDDTEVPAELPASLLAFKSQQRRWARGSVQTARLLLPRVWRSGRGLGARLQASLHLGHYLVHALMLVICLVGPLIAWGGARLPAWVDVALVAPLWLATVGPVLLHVVAQGALRGSLRWLVDLPRLMAVGCGLAVSNGLAALAGLSPRAVPFLRTPKRGDGSVGGYDAPRDEHAALEIALGLWTALGVLAAAQHGRWLQGAFLVLHSAGLLAVGLGSWREQRAASAAPPTTNETRGNLAPARGIDVTTGGPRFPQETRDLAP